MLHAFDPLSQFPIDQDVEDARSTVDAAEVRTARATDPFPRIRDVFGAAHSRRPKTDNMGAAGRFQAFG
jgi:hypothetical protein